MNIWEALLLGVVDAVDTMCVGASDGILEPNMKKRKMLILALVFGGMQFLTPVIGYFVGYAFKDYIIKYIPFIAAGILGILGVKSIVEAIVDAVKDKKEAKEREEKIAKGEQVEEIVEKHKVLSAGDIALQGIATSIDSLTLGFLYVDKEISIALTTFAIVGIVTFILSFICTVLGKQVGKILNKYAPNIAGTVFVVMAIKFLIEGIQAL
jgi:Predicted membrane protein